MVFSYGFSLLYDEINTRLLINVTILMQMIYNYVYLSQFSVENLVVTQTLNYSIHIMTRSILQ